MKKMARNQSKKSHSWWWNSHISPKNSKWLAENLEKMDTLVKEMLTLIEEEGDSFARKAEMYYKRRPELIQHVEDFYRMYRALAERYDHVTGELRNTFPSQLHSQSSTVSDLSSEPPSLSQSPSREHKKGSSCSSTSVDSDSECDDSQEKENDFSKELQRRIIELENELQSVKEKLEEYDASNGRCEHLETSDYEDLKSKILLLEADIGAANENLHAKEEELLELQKRLEEGSEAELEEKITVLKSEVLHYKNEAESLKVAADEAAKEHEANISSRDHEIELYKMELYRVSKMYSQEKSNLVAESARLDAAVQQLKAEVRAISDEKSLFEARVLELEHVIMEIKSKAASSADKFLSDKSKLEAMLLRLSESNSTLEVKLQSFENDMRRLEDERFELSKTLESFNHKYTFLEAEKEKLTIRVNKLTSDIKDRDAQLFQIGKHLHQLHLEHMKLIKEIDEEHKIGIKLRSTVKELEDEVERQRVMIHDGAEGKREAIRQLCFSLEHYRDGYHQLRQVLVEHKRFPVTAM